MSDKRVLQLFYSLNFQFIQILFKYLYVCIVKITYLHDPNEIQKDNLITHHIVWRNFYFCLCANTRKKL